MVLATENILERVQASAQGTHRDGTFELTFQAMATRCRVSFVCNPAKGKQFAAELIAWISEFESRYSRFLPGSLISRINEAAGRHWVDIDPETERIFNLCQELHFITRGVLDPTALPLLRIWDWKRGIVPSENEIAKARQKAGWRKVQRARGRIFLPEEGMALDLGGIGKEYAVDQAVQMALQQGIDRVLVDFGQDVRVHGQPTGGKPFWHVGLEDPLKPGTCWAGLGLREGAVASSGDYVRSFQTGGKRYGHIIDPRTGYPVANGCLGVSVVAPGCALAGALSTAAFVLGPSEGIALIDAVPNAEGCITTESGRHPSRRFYECVASENKPV